MKKPLSDKYMCELWRKACLIMWGGICLFCKEDGRVALFHRPVDVHHYVRRDHWYTRFDVLNGFLFCREDHDYVATKAGKTKLQMLMDPERLYYLEESKKIILTDVLVQRGMTYAEWLIEKADELKKIIKEGE